jgi:SAM-dependent methyltransferase
MPGMCRLCGAKLTQTLVDLGTMPLANSYLEPAALDKPEPAYPLIARLCEACLLVQVDHGVTADAIFSDYAYFSSYSSAWVAHAFAYADMMRRRFVLDARAKIVEIASNDGYLLQHFQRMGMPVLGVEPAANVAAAAEARGIPTEIAFFGAATAKRLLAAGHGADVMAANNVLAHVPDLNDFLAGFKILLKPEGIITFEFPHLLRLLEEVQFDTIYHEHYSYFSLLTAERAMARHGLRVFDVERLPTHGGSLRLFVCHAASARTDGPAVGALRAVEAKARLNEPAAYADFAPRVDALRAELRSFLDDAKRAGKQVAAYGAAAKGNTLLNYSGITTDRIAYVVDGSPHKQGHLLPGSHLPIYAPVHIFKMKPDYVLILPWNLADEISGQAAGIAAWGGRFVTAVPKIRIFSAPAQ